MAALDAAIHVFARRRVSLAERDARIESGHDECWRGSVGETAHRPNRMQVNFGNMTLTRISHLGRGPSRILRVVRDGIDQTLPAGIRRD